MHGRMVMLIFRGAVLANEVRADARQVHNSVPVSVGAPAGYSMQELL